MPRRNPRRLCIRRAFIGPSSVVWSERGHSSTFFHRRECWKCNGHGLSGPLHTRYGEPITTALQTLSSVAKAELVQIRFTLRSRDQHSKGMQDGCKVYMESYMASNGSRFIITWTIIFKNHLLEVGLTQNPETTAFRTFITVDSFYFIMVRGPTHVEIHWNSISPRA